jgi:2-polyprenyl-3-methyl-5-hydroxy-6-metoxy-1,4-benzoquinol methylase
MRFELRADSPLERLAKWLNLAPRAPAEAFFGMMLARVVMAGVRLGVFAALATESLSAEALAARQGLTPAGAQHLLEALEALGHVERKSGQYGLSPRSRKWLDPSSAHYMGSFIAFNYQQWEWWSHLEESLQSGPSVDLHRLAPGDERWRLYITAMFELARLSGPEVAGLIKLPAGAQRVLDLGGAHGWYAAQLCEKSPGLRATVLDLPGSVRVGRQLLARAGKADRVQHVEGDLLESALGGPYDAVLCFQVIHHLTAEQNRAMLARVHQAMRPGGILAVMDYFIGRRKPKIVPALLGLHYHLTSSAALFTLDTFETWLTEAGFVLERVRVLRRAPIQTLCLARRR